MKGVLLWILLTFTNVLVIQSIAIKQNADPLLIGAFNIQRFGDAKMDKSVVVSHLVKIVNRYDLVLVQEIYDASESAIYELLAKCNDASNDPFGIAISGRLGRSWSTEHYAFFYKRSKLEVTGEYQWDADRTSDVFERPPFIVKFKPVNIAGLNEFGFIPLHVKPSDAVTEIDALVDVYDAMVPMWEIQDFVIGGDLNADCTYVSDSEWLGIRLRTDARFDWSIGDDVNTRTRTNKVCAYDRLILTGNSLQNAYQANSATTYRFDEDLSLTEDEALGVSDHVPVEMVIS